jgi:hypothetical protein
MAGIKWRHEVGIYQTAAQAVMYTASGLSYTWIAGHTGLEARLIGEIMKVTAGMDKQKANALTCKITDKVETLFQDYSHEETHEPFDQCYDMKTIKPKAKYEAMIMQVKEELSKMGMPFN